MKRIPVLASVLVLAVILGCASERAPISGAPDASFVGKPSGSFNSLPSDKNIKNPEVAYNMALSFAKRQNMQAAHHYILLASKIRPSAKYSYVNAIFYLKEKRYKEALLCLKAASNMGAGSAQNRMDILNAEGVCHMQLGDNEEALKLFREVVNAPGLASRYGTYYNMGVIYIKQKKLIDAQAVFMKVVEENPGYYMAFDKLGLISAALGKWGEATVYYRKAVSLIKTNYDAKQADGAEIYCNYGEALYQTKKYPEARAALLEVIRIAPESPSGTKAKKLLENLGGL